MCIEKTLRSNSSPTKCYLSKFENSQRPIGISKLLGKYHFQIMGKSPCKIDGHPP